jgi:hypothetical protein
MRSFIILRASSWIKFMLQVYYKTSVTCVQMVEERRTRYQRLAGHVSTTLQGHIVHLQVLQQNLQAQLAKSAELPPLSVFLEVDSTGCVTGSKILDGTALTPGRQS